MLPSDSREARLIYRSLEQEPANQDKPKTSADYRDQLEGLLQDETKPERTADDFKKQLDDLMSDVDTVTTQNDFVFDVRPNQNAYFQFDTFVGQTCLNAGMTKIQNPYYTIERKADGVHVASKLPFSYYTSSGQWVRHTPGQGRKAQVAMEEITPRKSESEGVLPEPAPNTSELLHAIASPRRGWNAYEVSVPTGKAFFVRIGNYANPIRIGARTVSYGAPNESIGFYIRRERGQGTDKVIVEANKKVTDAKIEG